MSVTDSFVRSMRKSGHFSQPNLCKLMYMPSVQSSTGIPAQPGYQPVFGDFVPVPARILVLAWILAGMEVIPAQYQPGQNFDPN